jgi:hypothetical protein
MVTALPLACTPGDDFVPDPVTPACDQASLTPLPSACTCSEGDQRACYSGPAGTAGVGACLPGTQSCTTVGRRTQWRPCIGQVVPVREVCGDGIDNNCDGRVDEEACVSPQQVGYLRHSLVPGPSTIYAPGQASLLQRVPGYGDCPLPQVLVEMKRGSACVPPPPPDLRCDTKQALDYFGPAGLGESGAQLGGWGCRACDLIVQFGGAFGSVRQCATVPTMTCPSGQTATFVAGNDDWECLPTCDGGQYDPRFIESIPVCIPC